VSATACTFNPDDFHPTGATGAGGGTGSTSSSKSSSIASTSASTSASTTSNSSSSSTGGGCMDETGTPPGPCAGFTDDFAPGDLNWSFSQPSSINGNKATAVSNGGNPTSTFAQDLLLHQAFPLTECWMSFAIDTSDLGDTDRAFVDFVGMYKLHFTFTKTNVIFNSGSSYPTPFRGIFRVREHNGCLHVETAKAGDINGRLSTVRCRNRGSGCQGTSSSGSRWATATITLRCFRNSICLRRRSERDKTGGVDVSEDVIVSSISWT
jgi:hypothetical protein